MPGMHFTILCVTRQRTEFDPKNKAQNKLRLTKKKLGIIRQQYCHSMIQIYLLTEMLESSIVTNLGLF